MITSTDPRFAASVFLRGSRGIVFALASFALVMALARPIFAQDLDVFFDGSELKVADHFDRKTHFRSVSASEAIQFALDQAGKTGGSVRLGSGRFHLDEALQVPGQVRLSGSGRATKLLVALKNTNGIAIICKDAHGAEVSDLCLSAGDNDNALVGMIIDASGEVKVRNVYAVGFANYGVWVRNHAFLCGISGCVLAGNGKVNLYLENMHAGTFGNFIANLIAKCTIYGGGKGIECNHVIVLNIVGCSIYQTNGTGIHLHSQSNSVLVSGSRTFQITGDAMVVEGSTHELNVTGNIFCWSTGNGIVVRQGAWGTITGNNVNFTFENAVLSEGAESLVRDNLSLPDITHAEIGKLDGGKAIQGPYKKDGFVQTYQPELTQKFIESFK